MWELRDIERRAAELDFSSAGLGHRSVAQLFSGGILVANAVELTDWDDEVQLIVCEACGTVHCEPGGWVSFRNAGDYVAIAPDHRVFGADESDRHEYRPPDFVAKLGWPFLSASTYLALRESIPQLPEMNALRALSQCELIAILQWEAPARVLGTPFARPALRTDLVIACSDGDLATDVGRLSRELQGWATGNVAVRLEGVRDGDAPIEFHLDVRGAPAWRPLVLRDGAPLLQLEPGLVAVLAE